MDTTTAFQNVRQALDTIMALQPMDGKATRTGTSLTIRQFDASGVQWHFQHAAGGTMRAVRLELDSLYERSRVVTPLDTDMVVSDYLRAMLVEALK